MTKETITASDEAWDERVLGADENYVKVAEDEAANLYDNASGSQLISIRMQKSTIEDLKLIASLNRLGYQTLMKQVIHRFIECEKKQILRELITEKIREKSASLSSDDKTLQVKQNRKKTA